MTKSDLLHSAAALKQPSEKSATEYLGKSEFLAAEMNRLMEIRADLTTLIGEGNTSMMEDNHRNHARFMSSVFTSFSPETLVETVLWVYRAYRSHGFHLTYWPAQLDEWVNLYKFHLTTDAYAEIYPFYHWMIINQPVFVIESDKIIMPVNGPIHE
jgi:hypothetical protein